MSPEYRFWNLVVKGKQYECWNWVGSKPNDGYKRFKLDGKTIGAHVYAWELTRNCKVPKGKMILHLCDNSACVNPNHLYCGTQVDNMRDRNTRNPVSCELFGKNKSKLYLGEIELIRKLKDKFSSGYVAKMFKVNQMTICRVWRAESYLCKEGYYA